MQSGKCRECGSLGVWPQVIAVLLGILIFLFFFFFSWFPLLPDWLQTKLSFATDTISEQAQKKAQDAQGEREEAPGAKPEAPEDKKQQADDSGTANE